MEPCKCKRRIDNNNNRRTVKTPVKREQNVLSFAVNIFVRFFCCRCRHLQPVDRTSIIVLLRHNCRSLTRSRPWHYEPVTNQAYLFFG